MTRSAGDALSEQQLKLSNACENLLASDEWNNANAFTTTGVENRLRLLTSKGLPGMRVVSLETLATLGRIPRSHEGFQEDALTAVQRCGHDVDNTPHAVICFFSHRWLRPNWCEALEQDLPWGTEGREEAKQRGYSVGDPDDAGHSKAKALIDFGNWFTRRLASRGLADSMGLRFGTLSDSPQLFFWIDWACTDQDNAGPDMAALPAYVGACSIMLAAWTDEYAQRAWCQIELLMGYAFMHHGKTPLVLPEKFVDRDQRKFDNSRQVVADPAQGQLSNPTDKAVVAALRDVAAGSTMFTWGRVCAHNLSCDQGERMWTLQNILMCFQCFGLLALDDARRVEPGNSTLTLLTPAGPTVQGPEQVQSQS